MSWFVVGGIAIGATAGAIVGSKKGGDDVWKDALIGGAIGGTAGYGAGALAPAAAAEAAVPAAVGAEGGAGILGAEAVAGGSGLALGGAGLETGGAMAGGAGSAGILGAEGAAVTGATSLPAGGFAATATPTAYGATAPLGSSVVPSAYSPLGTGVGGSSASYVPATGNTIQAAFAPGMQAPIQMVSAPEAAFGSSSLPTGAAAMPGGASSEAAFGSSTLPTGAKALPGGESFGGATQSPLEKGFGSAMSWLSEPKNAMLTGVLGLGALSMFNKNNEDNFGGANVVQAGYPLSPNFKPSRYQPTRSYADGGVTDLDVGQRTMYARQAADPVVMMKKGGTASGEDRAPSWVGRSIANVNDPGLYIDRDEDTAYQDALTAAQTRMGKAAKGANVQLAAMQKQKPLGGVNLGPVAGVEEHKAGGGITSLGGYAHGGNPRLLRGPGDGMSDDIPASIADKQPARLADGEFVVPADVVSGLGNGSTEAGAKKLHEMMDRVRVARTGTKKQGKQIDADKYIGGKASGGIIGYAGGNLVLNPETNEIGSWEGANEYGLGGTWTPYNAGSLQQSASYPNTQYNPDYYNPQMAQQNLATAQTALDQQKGLKSFDPSYYLNTYKDVAADPYYGTRALEHYQQYGIKEGRSPYEGGQAGAQFADPAALQNAQAAFDAAQKNVDRLQNSSIKYDPYTLANRPTASEPQYYGNIYHGNTPDFATPGYTLAGNLGEWSNVAGENQRALQPASKNQQITQAYLQNLGRAPDQQGFNYWMESELPTSEIRRYISGSPEQQSLGWSPEERAIINQAYQDYLGRDVEGGGLQYWEQRLGDQLNQDEMRGYLMNSPEAQQYETNFLTNAYNQYLGRAPDEAGLDWWRQQQVGTTNQQEIRDLIRNSPEAETHFLTNTYNQYLGRAPDQAGLNWWQDQLVGATNQQEVLDLIRNSPEAQAYAASQQVRAAPQPAPQQAQAAPQLAPQQVQTAMRRGGILAAKK